MVVMNVLFLSPHLLGGGTLVHCRVHNKAQALTIKKYLKFCETLYPVVVTVGGYDYVSHVTYYVITLTCVPVSCFYIVVLPHKDVSSDHANILIPPSGSCAGSWICQVGISFVLYFC